MQFTRKLGRLRLQRHQFGQAVSIDIGSFRQVFAGFDRGLNLGGKRLDDRLGNGLGERVLNRGNSLKGLCGGARTFGAKQDHANHGGH